MGRSIDKITIQGFKSIRSLEEFELGPVNLLIGANGSGKSNFVSFFSLLREMVEGRLQLAVNKAGGADSHLFLGPRITEEIVAKVEFGPNRYEFSLEPTADNRLIFASESIRYHAPLPGLAANLTHAIGSGHAESKLAEYLDSEWTSDENLLLAAACAKDTISNWVAYHCNDTSATAAIRRTGTVRDDERLRAEGENLAAFLFRLCAEEKGTYDLVVETVRLAAPFFHDFRLRPRPRIDEDNTISLAWTQKDSDYPFHPSQLSDGTLRFIALATALLQPNPPSTILIDEPELGLHPQALDILADLILQARSRTQLIVSTQSPALLNAFDPDQIIVVDRVEGESRFRRLSTDELREWLKEDYTLGELWQKNVYGGGISHE